MLEFVERRFPDDISWGATGGSGFRTTVIESGGGHEQRNVDWSQSRGQWDVTHGARSEAMMDRLIEWFNAMRGRAIGFRFRDWTDFEAETELFGTGDGVEDTFTLRKTYQVGDESYEREITKPVDNGPIIVTLAGAPQEEGVDYALDRTTGIVVMTAPPAMGQELRWSGAFDVPVRFDSDLMQISQDFEDVSSWSVKVVEIRP